MTSSYNSPINAIQGRAPEAIALTFWPALRPGGGGGLPYETDGDARRLA